jgi:hypothetical protein
MRAGILERCRGIPGLLALVVAAALSAPAIAGPEAEAASAAGDTAMQSRRPGEAIVEYRRAQALGFRDTASLDARIAGAEAQRQAFLRICDTGTGEPARRACLAARLPGAPDEPRVLRRLESMDEAAHRRIEPSPRMQGNSSTLESDSFPSATEARYSNAAAPTLSH